MPQTKSGRKKWRKKQRTLMEAALANQSVQTTSIYQSINFVPPIPTIPPPPPTQKPTVTNSSYSFTPIIPSNPNPPLLQSRPSMEIPIVQKKQNSFDLPDNCPASLR